MDDGRTTYTRATYGAFVEGDSFEWQTTAYRVDLKSVEGMHGDQINKIRFYLNNGENSPYLGGGSGRFYNYDVEHDDYITEVKFKIGSELNSLTLTTNSGKIFKIGGAGGTTEHSFTMDSKVHIVGLYGTKSATHVLSLGLILSEEARTPSDS